MQQSSHTSVGYAVESSGDLAIKKAFAEAWERLCFIKYCSDRNLGIQNTSGFAAGESSGAAAQSAKEELIERAVFLMAWQSQSGWKEVRFSKFKTKYLKFALALKGWHLAIYNLTSSEGIVTCLFAQHQNRGLVFDSAFSNNHQSTEQKLLNSVLKNIFHPTMTPIEKLPENARPIDHAKFYASSKNLRSVDFLLNNESENIVFKLENPELLETKIIHEPDDFPPVAACFHPNWPKISWGANSVQGKNPWPHPLA